MKPIKRILYWYFTKQALPYWCVLLLDCLFIFISGVATYWLFNKTLMFIDNRFEVIYTLLFYVALSLIAAKFFSTYAGIVRYSSFDDLVRVACANGVTLVLCLGASYVTEALAISSLSALNQTQIFTTFVLATLLMCGLRIIVKVVYDVSFSDSRSQRVLIYGALTGGVGLAKYIRSQRPQRFSLQGFISHSKRAGQMQLMGKKVYNIDDDLARIVKENRIDAILVSPARVKEFQNKKELQDTLIDAGCKIYISHYATELKEGENTDETFAGMQLKEVSVEDLLPRDEIEIDLKAVGELLSGKTVLITGSAGSIGSEMVRQIAYFKPKKLVLIDQAETPQHDIRLMMAKQFPEVDAKVLVTSISRVTRMDAMFRIYRPDYVFHAAAYKHVPMMEDNPSEAVLNNIHGTKVIADLAVKYGVKKFVMISTDKAVNPTNVMGCSKRICEIYVQSLNRKLESEGFTGHTQFVTTRFGNVLGSNGSVIPLFKEQIKNGGPVTVTDERIVRFFMLIPEACKLVLEAGTMGHGGEIFVFDMGQPVRIADLAKRMISLSGAKNIEIQYIGLREGEKLYEEVLNELEGTKPTFHEKIHIAEVREYDYATANQQVLELINIAKQYDDMATVKKMKEIVPEYKSNNSKYEVLDK